jgi:hypothetical protein
MWGKLFSLKKNLSYLYYFFFSLLAIFLPVVLWPLNLSVAPLITTSQDMLFGLFGFVAAFLLFFLVVKEILTLSKNDAADFDEWLLRLLPYLVYFFFLFIVVEFHEQSWDYGNYEKAARAIIAGTNPYDIGHSLYPPIFASTLASIYKFANLFLPLIGMEAGKSDSWLFVFYVHHSLLFFWASLSYRLALILGERLGISRRQNLIVISLLFLANYPLIRNIHLNQITIFVLFSVLMTLVFLTEGKPFLGGLFIAIGGLIKIFPFALLLPLLLLKKWKALTGAFLGSFFLFLLNTKFAQDLLLWKQFVNFYLNFPVERESSLWFRNSSMLSFLRQTVRLTRLNEKLVLFFFLLLALVILLWLSIRVLKRERVYRNTYFGSVGSLVDFSVLSILLAPSAWVHHYLLSMPLAIWAISQSGRKNVTWMLFALLGIFLMPLFDVYPFSYIRLAGLLCLLFLTSPKSLLD